MNSATEPTPPHLPTLVPPTATLLHRAQGTLGLLREVVQESSAEYWHMRGKVAIKKQDWVDAVISFRNCVTRDSNHWRATLQLVIALAWQSDKAAAEVLRQA